MCPTHRLISDPASVALHPRKTAPWARPCCPVTRGSECVFWVLSGTKPQYLPRGRTHVLSDQHVEGGNELVFWFHLLLQSSCLFFHCSVPGACTWKGLHGQSVCCPTPLRCQHPCGYRRWGYGSPEKRWVPSLPLVGGNQVQDGDKRQSCRVDGDTWAGPGNDLMCEATVCGGRGK